MELFNITKSNIINQELVNSLKEKHGEVTKKFNTVDLLDDLEDNLEVGNSGE